MKYTTEEAMLEIRKRSNKIVIGRCRRECRILSGLVGVLSIVLLLTVSALPGEKGVASEKSVYGAFLLNREAGGYVLVALLAFAMGVAITVLCQRYKKMKKQRQSENREE